MTRSPRKNADVVRRYLEAIGTTSRKGRRRTPESIAKRLAAIEAALPQAGALQRLQLVQERIDLTDELRTAESAADIGPLEAEFAEFAAAYGEAKGISYLAWREMGVSAEILKRAGIAQTRRRSGT